MRKAEKILVCDEIETNMEEFSENFLIQYYNIFCKIQIDGVNSSALQLIRKALGSNNKSKMLHIFEAAIDNKAMWEQALYSSPPRDDILKQAYYQFIPDLLIAFKEETKELQGFPQLLEKVEAALMKTKKPLT